MLCKEYKAKIQTTSEIAVIKEKIRSIPAEVIDVVKVRKELSRKKNQMISTRDQIQEDKSSRDSKKSEYKAICDFLGAYSKESLYGQRENIQNLRNDILNLKSKLAKENDEKARNQKRVQLLDGILVAHLSPPASSLRMLSLQKQTFQRTKK